MPKNPVAFPRQQEMAQLLSALDGDELEGAVKLIKEDESMAHVDGDELELDFDVLSPMTISKLDRYLRRIRPEGSKMDNPPRSRSTQIQSHPDPEARSRSTQIQRPDPDPEARSRGQIHPDPDPEPPRSRGQIQIHPDPKHW